MMKFSDEQQVQQREHYPEAPAQLSLSRQRS